MVQTVKLIFVFVVVLATFFVIFHSSTFPDNYFKLDSNYSRKQTICIFFGTRPEIIKLSPVIAQFSGSNIFTIITVFTGQHPDRIQPFLNLFDISVDVWLHNAFVRNQSITDLIGRILLELRSKVSFTETDIWLVQGDTTTSLAVALLAFHHGIRIAHVEAGLRTYNMYSPFPEEFNRKTISSISTLHFAPTENNRKLLLEEGIPDAHIFVTGNTVIDAVKFLNENKKTVIPQNLKTIDISDKVLILVTIDRRENLSFVSQFYTALKLVPCAQCLFIVPVHPNPEAGKHARNICKMSPDKFLCVSPLSFEELHWVLNHCKVILTDSVGLQEEATWYHKPVIILQENTEYMEAVNSGSAFLVGKNTNILKKNLLVLLNTSYELWQSRNKHLYPFGNGNSSHRIYEIIVAHKNMPNKNVILYPLNLAKGTNYKLDDRSVCVVLQIFKRNTIERQLKAVFNQTLMPTTVLMLQNGYYFDISKVVHKFRKRYPNVEIIHIASSKNLRFHGRFHLAYMMKESFVSVWDDDVLPSSKWIEYCINYSMSHQNALVGANGRTFIEIKNNKMIQSDYVGENDFVGHTWTLPRENLKYYLSSEMLTLHTGEDIQLSFALQRIGIKSFKPPGSKDIFVKNTKEAVDQKSSWRLNQAPRQLLFCKLLKYGFRTLKCINCHQTNIIDSCIKYYETKAQIVENEMQKIDKEGNNLLAWSIVDSTKGTLK